MHLHNSAADTQVTGSFEKCTPGGKVTNTVMPLTTCVGISSAAYEQAAP